jgi:hypothetical protein
MFMRIGNVLTILAGAFVCAAGLYATITAIIDAYDSGIVGTLFSYG